MIAVDTSALVGIALAEPEAPIFSELIGRQGGVVGTPTLVETATVLTRLGRPVADAFLDGFIANPQIQVRDFSLAMFRVASSAYWEFGKGRAHPAQLNFGDCFAYGIAKVLKLPLLFKGNDFALTDIEPAWRP